MEQAGSSLAGFTDSGSFHVSAFPRGNAEAVSSGENTWDRPVGKPGAWP